MVWLKPASPKLLPNLSHYLFFFFFSFYSAYFSLTFNTGAASVLFDITPALAFETWRNLISLLNDFSHPFSLAPLSPLLAL